MTSIYLYILTKSSIEIQIQIQILKWFIDADTPYDGIAEVGINVSAMHSTSILIGIMVKSEKNVFIAIS